MIPLLEQHGETLAALCKRFAVKRLELFGSASKGRFDPARSDLDFIVEFHLSPSIGAADQYFGLLEGLEDLFDRRIDLLELPAIQNPYLLRSINSSRTLLYAA